MHMGLGKNTWSLAGNVYGHPFYHDGKHVYVSTPKEFDEEKMQVKAFSGRVYQLGECGGKLEEEMQYIRDDCLKI